jgi:3-oxoacyl-ACP reductase-like protein
MTGTIKIDYIKQTFIEDISIHIDPRITYANKLLPSPVSEPASAPASAPVDPVAPEPAPEPEPEEEPIDNEDIIDIFYSTNLNKNQNYYIFNMLETMS